MSRFVECSGCLEKQAGRCLRGKNIDGCRKGITALDSMRHREVRKDDQPPHRYRKAWWE